MKWFSYMFAGLAALVLLAPSYTQASTLPLSSREYKMTLDNKGFKTMSPLVPVEALWQDVSAIAQMIPGVVVSGNATLKSSTPREVYFYDTPGSCLLRQQNLQFRVRNRLSPAENRKLNLKARGPDRHFSAYRTVAPLPTFCPGLVSASKCKPESKFEEDISLMADVDKKLVFRSGFSKSSTREVDNSKMIATLADAKDLFDFELPEGTDLSTPLRVVGDLVVHEYVFAATKIQFEPGCKVEMETSLWYEPGEMKKPITSEFSFTIETDSGVEPESWSRKCIAGLNQLYNDLQSAKFKSDWLVKEPETKTSFVYSWSKKFCEN